MTSSSDIPGDTPAREEVDDVAIHRLRTAWRWGHWIRCPDLQKFLTHNDFDLVHAQSYRNYFCEVGAKIAKSRQTPFVITPRGSLLGYRYIGASGISWIPNLAFDLATRKRALRGATIITTSPGETDDAVRLGIPAVSIRMIPHGLDFKSMPPFQPRAPRGETLLFVGRLTSQRNLEFLLRGFAVASKDLPRVTLTIVGDPIPSKYSLSERSYYSRVRRLTARLNLESKVRFVGGVYGSSLWTYYRESDIFIYPVRYDNFGFALLEAAYFGLPIVSTQVGIATELRNRSGGVLLVDHHDDHGLSNAIHKACADVQWRHRAGEALHEAAKLFSIERNADAHESLYHSLRDPQNILRSR